MRKHPVLWTTILLGSILIGGCIVTAWQNPLRQPDAIIRASIVEDTPIGSSREHVEAFADSKDWNWNRSYGVGVYHNQDYRKIGGVKSIETRIGRYQGFPHLIHVKAQWVFSNDNILVGVEVWRVAD
jgi:hypothetical protein